MIAITLAHIADWLSPLVPTDKAVTVRIHFSEEINYYNSESLNIRQALAEILCHNLAQVHILKFTDIFAGWHSFCFAFYTMRYNFHIC